MRRQGHSLIRGYPSRLADDPKYYGFWDGDFTFHTTLPDNSIFRVRIDNESPEERARANMRNANKQGSFDSIRPSTEEEIGHWLNRFSLIFPLRSDDETRLLRRLRLEGPLPARETGTDLTELDLDVLGSLTGSRFVVRDFKEVNLVFVRKRDGVFFLTADGFWLTSLMEGVDPA